MLKKREKVAAWISSSARSPVRAKKPPEINPNHGKTHKQTQTQIQTVHTVYTHMRARSFGGCFSD